MKDVSPSVPDFSLIVDLKPLAQAIEQKFGDLLEPAPEGIYTLNHVEPVLVPGKQYYQARQPLKVTGGKPELIPFDDIHQVTGSVYQEDGTCLIPGYMLKNKEKFLSNTPLSPYHGVKIARLVYDHRINQQLRWVTTKQPYLHKVQQHLVAGAYSDEDLDIMLEWYALEEIDDFVRHHEWHLHTLKQRDTLLTIVRGEDYRIAEWNRMYAEGTVKL